MLYLSRIICVKIIVEVMKRTNEYLTTKYYYDCTRAVFACPCRMAIDLDAHSPPHTFFA